MIRDVSDKFVGRVSEMAQLLSKIELARTGNGQFVALSGEPGIGKTRLVTELARIADARGISVQIGRCREASGAPPYWPWRQALAGSLGEDSYVVAGLRGDSDRVNAAPQSATGQFQLFESFVHALQQLTEVAPMLIILEDIHWADSASLKLLEFVQPDIADLTVMIVCTYRNPPSGSDSVLSNALGEIARHHHSSQIRLSGLGRDEVRTLFEQTAQASAPDLLIDRAHETTRGNALFITETIRLLESEGRLNSDSFAREEHWQLGVPAGVSDAIMRRFSGLQQSSGEMLYAAAVLGREFELDLLAKVIGCTASSALHSLDHPLSIGLIQKDGSAGTRFRFSHALVQQAVLESISNSERVQMHRSAAMAIESEGEDYMLARIDRLAHHYTESQSVTGPGPVTRYSLAAGDQALVSNAYEDAAFHFRKIVDLRHEMPIDELTATALFGLGRALTFSAAGERRNEAGVALKMAFDFAISSGRHDLVIDIAKHPVAQHLDFRADLLEMSSRAIDLVDSESLDAGYIQNNLGYALQFASGDFESALSAIETAISIGERYGDLDLQATAIANLLDVKVHHGVQSEDDIQLALKGVEIAVKCGNPDAEAKCLRFAAYTSRMIGDGEYAIRYAERGLKAAQRYRHKDGLLYALKCVSEMVEISGDWERYRELNDQALAIDPGNTPALVSRISVEHLTGRFEDELVFYERILLQASDDYRDSYYNYVNAALSAVVTSDVSPERRPVGKRLARHVLEMHGIPRRAELQAQATIGLAACMDQDIESASHVLEWFESQPESLDSHKGLAGPLARLMAIVGRSGEAVELLDPVYRQISEGRMAVGHARVYCDLAEVLISRTEPGDTNRAAELLEESEGLVDQFGLHGLTGRIEMLSLQAGRQSLSVRKRRNPAGLSNRELDVLRLLATGTSNPEIAEQLIISRHTVVRHLANIYSKISVSTRAEASAFAVRNGIS